MTLKENEEGLAVLQLHKWDPYMQLELAEYREAFLSPTRELLLLLSYQSQALLLPLARGDPYCVTSRSCKYDSEESVNSSACRTDLLDSFSSSYESVGTESKASGSNNFPYISDVNSLAWGMCGDTYTQYKEALFKEFLIIVGSCGVTFHGFRQVDEIDTTVRQSSEDENTLGRWVEWGCCSTSSCDNESLGDATNSSRTSEAERTSSYSEQDSTSHTSGFLATKKWLRSFLSSTKAMESDGVIWTNFPDESKFPFSATVVSFSVEFNDPILLDFYSGTRSVSGKGNEEKKLNNMVDDDLGAGDTSSDGLNTVVSNAARGPYTCCRVFSSWFHYLVGFVMTSGFDDAKSKSDFIFKTKDIVVLVALLDTYGLRWLYSVKLPEKGISLESEWVDFQFSDKFLISLNKFGSTILYGAVTGEFIACLDILQIHGVKPQQTLKRENLSEGVNDSSKDDSKQNKLDAACNLPSQAHSSSYKQSFQRLIVAPYSCLFTVVDECGLLYIICASDHVPDNYITTDKILPQYLKLGVLAPWVVSSSNISQQKVLSTLLGCDNSFIRNDFGNLGLQHAQYCDLREMIDRNDLALSGFSTISQIDMLNEFDSRCLQCRRKLLIPIARHDESDIISFSPFGVARFIRRNSTESERSCILHTSLCVKSKYSDDSSIDIINRAFDLQIDAKVDGEAVGCLFQGCLYLVTRSAISIVFPTVLLSSYSNTIDSMRYQSTITSEMAALDLQKSVMYEKLKQQESSWQVTVLDRLLLFEGPDEADRLCMENGWDLRLSRLRRLHLALAYIKFEEMDLALGTLAEVNIAEEGVLLLIFAAMNMVVQRVGNDTEVSAALRILALGAQFAIKMLRKYAILELKNECTLQRIGGVDRSLPLLLSDKEHTEVTNSRRLHEMAYYLEVIRDIQYRLAVKFQRLGQGSEDTLGALQSEDNYKRTAATVDGMSLERPDKHEPAFDERNGGFHDYKDLSLVPVEPLGSEDFMSPEMQIEDSIGVIPRKKLLLLENPKEMFARWEMDNLDLRNVVKDALLSGRLPLAVLQLHLHRMNDSVDVEKSSDTFAEVRDIGRTIAYDLLLKGETTFAVSLLQQLGEDIEVCLKQLLFGTVSKSLRQQIAEELKKYGFLRSYELDILDRILLIERIYPCSNFWKTYASRRKDQSEFLLPTEATGDCRLQLLSPPSFRNIFLECGDVDGVVLGSWAKFDGSGCPDVDDDSSHAYWAAAAVWSNAWDQTTIDRILLDQPFLLGVHVVWESQFEYYVCHNDWDEVAKFLYMIPSSLLAERSLLVSLDSLQSVSSSRYNVDFPDYGGYACSPDELDAVCLNIPNVKIFSFPACEMCSSWLRVLISKELAKRFIFLKEYWEGAEIISLLAQCGFIDGENVVSTRNGSLHQSAIIDSADVEILHPNSLLAFHKLLVHYCAQNNLPFLLDLYLDHHKLALDNDAVNAFEEATGDCQWAKWLLFTRIKGCEYESSFFNARALLVHDVISDSSLRVLEANEMISTVDDIAESGWMMAAMATLMFAPLPVQSCLSSGSVNRSSSSFQCTLENLRPALQKFPTLWRTLVASCLGHDTAQSFWSFKGRNALSAYINWRDSVFYSSGHDTSLLQMLPCWFPKSLRRLVQLFVQGPLGWQSMTSLTAEESYLQRDIEFLMNAQEFSEISAMSWEAAIQKQIEQELYPSSVEETGLALEQHLHRGRALAAFNQLLGSRVQKLKSDGNDRGQSSALLRGQSNVQSDVQMLLSPLEKNEESLLCSVLPLAITHYQDSVLVASCALLLEICGLSASVLRVDVAVLRRIHSFYRSNQIMQQNQLLSNSATLRSASNDVTIADSLAQALADYYLHQSGDVIKQEDTTKPVTNNQPSTLLLILSHLEKASLLAYSGERTCGSWLLSGDGDGNELRSQQKAASQCWNLVTVFCRMHQIPLSTVYLAFLARDNDWIGFLSEAQVGGYPFDSVVQVAAKEFSDPRLKTHILTVLRGMQSRKKGSLPSCSDSPKGKDEASPSDQTICVSAELFQTLAQCEKQKEPGKALLLKAKELNWSLLAVVASCFPDVTALSCLTVWLEITAAREISLIRQNEIASLIASKVGAAVEASNSFPAGDRVSNFHYNRKSPKRRRVLNTVLEDVSNATTNNTSNGHAQIFGEELKELETKEDLKLVKNSEDWSMSLPKLVVVLCQQQQYLPLLKAFEMFLPSCPLLPFIRALQAFSQMRLSEASAHLGSFSFRIKEEASWIGSTAVKAADAILSTCPSPYEKRCLLQLLASTDFADGGSAATYYRRLYRKVNLAEPALRELEDFQLGNETLDDASLLTALENNGYWEQARSWAHHLEASSKSWKSAVHRVTERQAESMVVEWKEFLWDVPEERVALWRHCQNLFLRYSFPPLQAGLFFLKHAEAGEKELPPRELYELILLSLQWLSGIITQSTPVCPLNFLREIETRVWLLAVESEAQMKGEEVSSFSRSSQDQMTGNTGNIIDQTADVIMKMDSHTNTMKSTASEKGDTKETNNLNHKSLHFWDAGISSATSSTKIKRRTKVYGSSRQSMADISSRTPDVDESSPPAMNFRYDFQEENLKLDVPFSSWEERIGPAELERAVLSLLEFGQITAAKQLQHKLSSGDIPFELRIVDAALKFAELSTPLQKQSLSSLDEDLRSLFQSHNLPTYDHLFDPLQVLENLSGILTEGRGRGLCKRIFAVVKAANILGIPFVDAFEKQPAELLQLLSLKAQDSFDEARLLVQSHPIPATCIAKILAESFLKGLLAAHRGGYIDFQKEEGPAPLLWRFSDFLKWADLCPSEQEMGHALMRLVITGQEIPHACEVELLILSHHFYQSSACLDGVDVLVALAATRVEAYVSEGDFSCLARLITGVGNFHRLNFILGILIENGQLDLLLQKYSAAADANTAVAQTVRGFRMAVVTALKHFNPNDLDALATVYNHFDMKHETASLLESRAEQSYERWHHRHDKDHNEDLLQSMHFYIEAAEVHSSIDAGNKTRSACAQASLVSLQIRMPDIHWLNLSETSARRLLVDQTRFQEALIVAEAYNLNQPSEWTPVLWNQMLKPEVVEHFLAEFVAVLPLQNSVLIELAKFYRSEMVARGDQSNFSVWLTGGGLPAEWAKYLGRSFRCLLKRTRDLKIRLQMAAIATGFNDVVDGCNRILDKVPENAGPLVLRKGHGGAYLPLM